MQFCNVQVGQKFWCVNYVSGLVDKKLPPYTRVTPGDFKPGQPYNSTHPYGRKNERTAYVFIPNDTEVELVQ